MPKFSTIERRAIEQHFLQSVVQFFGPKQNHVGCGLLFRRDGRHYLVSAAHVLEPLKVGTSHLLMPERPPSNDTPSTYVRVGSGELVFTAPDTALTGGDKDGEDVAAYLLTKESADRFNSNGWVFMNDTDIYEGPGVGDCIIVGYPAEELIKTEESPGRFNVSAAPIFVHTRPIADPPNARRPIGRELFLEYPEGLGNLSGVSGAPVWGVVEVDPAVVWQASKQFKIVGIQHSAWEGSFIRTTFWIAVHNMLEAFEAGLVPKAGVPNPATQRSSSPDGGGRGPTTE